MPGGVKAALLVFESESLVEPLRPGVSKLQRVLAHWYGSFVAIVQIFQCIS
jgi:hypothetical protein